MTGSHSADAQRFDAQGNPVRMFHDAQGAMNFARRLETDDRNNLSPVRKQIMAMKNLAPPRPQTGQNQDLLNISWGEGRHALDKYTKPFRLRLNQELEPVEVDVWEPDPTLADNHRKTISRAASKALRQWPGSRRELKAVIDDMGSFGLGVAIYPEERSPIFEHIPRRRVFFPADCPPDIDRIPAVVIKHRWSAEQLWEKYDLPESVQETLGWNAEALKAAMMALHRLGNPKEYEKSTVPWEKIETEIRNNYMSEWIADQQIDVYQIVHRDFHTDDQGNIDTESYSIAIVLEHAEYVEGARQKGNTEAFYLRQHAHAYSSLDQYLAIFPLDAAQEDIHGLQGYGYELFPKSLVASRMKNHFVDDWNSATSRYWSTSSADSAMRFQLTRRGNNIFVPLGDTTPLEMPVRDNMASNHGALGMVENEINAGLPHHQPADYIRATMNRESATKEQMRELAASEETQTDISDFELHLDLLYTEFYRRLTMENDPHPRGKTVRRVFTDELEFANLPKEVWEWKNVRLVRAKRTVGPGSPFARRQSATAIMQVRGALPPIGQHEALEEYITAFTGGENLRRFIPTFDRINEPTHHNWEAQQESLALKQGGEVLPALGTQNDGIHIEQHLRDFERELQTLATQDIPQLIMQMAPILANLTLHLDTHLARMEQDETQKAMYDGLKPLVEEVRRLTLSTDRKARQLSEVQRRAEAALQAQQNPTVDPETQAKMDAKAAEAQLDATIAGRDEQRTQATWEADEARKQQAFEADQARKQQEPVTSQ